MEGFRNGAIIATLNHLAHRATEGTDPKAARKKAAAQARQQRLNKLHAKLKSTITKFGDNFSALNKTEVTTADVLAGQSAGLAGYEGVQNSSAGNWMRGGKAVSSGASNFLRLSKVFIGVGSEILTAFDAISDFRSGAYYSGSAKVVTTLAIYGSSKIPYVGPYLSTSIGITNVVYGEQFYGALEMTFGK